MGPVIADDAPNKIIGAMFDLGHSVNSVKQNWFEPLFLS